MIGVPTVDGWIHSRLMRALIVQMAGRPLNIVAGVAPYEKARNQIVDGFLTSDCTHLAMFDDDTIPPEDVIDKMLALDTDVATGIYPLIMHDELVTNVCDGAVEDGQGKLMSVAEIATKKEPFPIKTAGLGCSLIRREVLEKIGAPQFTSLWFQNGKFCEGDAYFCGRALEEGFKVIADPRIICNHVKQVTL